MDDVAHIMSMYYTVYGTDAVVLKAGALPTKISVPHVSPTYRKTQKPKTKNLDVISPKTVFTIHNFYLMRNRAPVQSTYQLLVPGLQDRMISHHSSSSRVGTITFCPELGL